MTLKHVDTIVNLKQRKRELFEEWLNEQIQLNPNQKDLAMKSYRIGYADALLEIGNKLGEFLNKELAEEDPAMTLKLMWTAIK